MHKIERKWCAKNELENKLNMLFIPTSLDFHVLHRCRFDTAAGTQLSVLVELVQHSP